MSEETLVVDYFSDALCVWAYAADRRIEELKYTFGDRIQIRQRLINLFGATAARMEKGWADQGGYQGFGQHVQHVMEAWDHVSVHEDIWQNPPTSSLPPHLFLKAVELHLANTDTYQDLAFHKIVVTLRHAFFAQCQDISNHSVLQSIAHELGYEWSDLAKYLDNGQAHAALHQDQELKDEHQITGSPTLVINEGRQKLYGNLGYHVLEANIQEVLRNPDTGEASWC